jgi:hypothetical protein
MKKIILISLLALFWGMSSNIAVAQTRKKVAKRSTVQRQQSTISLVGRTYSGEVNMGPLTENLITNLTVDFISSSNLTITTQLNMRLPDQAQEALRLFDDEHVLDPKVQNKTYSIKNGVVVMPNTTDKFYIKDNGKRIYWYVNDQFNGNLYRVK